MATITPAALWPHKRIDSCNPPGMPAQEALRGFKELRRARRELGMPPAKCGGEYYWRYPFEH